MMTGDHFSLDPFAIQGIASDLKATSGDLQRQASALSRLESEITAAGPLAMGALGAVSSARSLVQQAGRDLDNVHGDVVQRLGLLVQTEDPFGGAFDMSLALDILNPPPPPPPEHHHGGGGLFGSILGGIESLGGDAVSGLGDAASWAWGGVSSGASWAWGGISSGASSVWNWATNHPMDALHTGLDVLGMVPVVGDFANGANALIYLGQGDYADAAISGAALVPVAGDAALAMRLGAKGLKGVEAASEAERLSADAAKLASEGGDVAAAERAATAGGEAGRLRDPATGRFIPDPNNPPSPYVFTDAQRRAAWKAIYEDPNSGLTEAERAQIKARGWRGPQRPNADTGEMETMELSHEPVPLRDGGTEVVPRWPDEHAAVDPHRQLKKGP